MKYDANIVRFSSFIRVVDIALKEQHHIIILVLISFKIIKESRYTILINAKQKHIIRDFYLSKM